MNASTADFVIDPNARCYSHLSFRDDPADFQFPVMSDSAGGARPGVFAKAVEMANLLQPEFVVQVGDLIEGYDDDEDQIRAWWQEIDDPLKQLEMPFFFLPGNHDYYSEASIKVWRERFGDDRGYYHFVYNDVLFLMVNNQDPPVSLADLKRDDPDAFQQIMSTMQALGERQAKGLLEVEDAHLVDELADIAGRINISEAQVEYFRQVLEDHADVLWTFCLTHAPPHYSPVNGEKDPGNFAKIESLMSDRAYTVFSGHTHVYDYEQRDGHDFVTTATTGGISFERPGAMDHLVWVTMTHDGPKIANLLMNGILGKEGPPKDTTLSLTGLYSGEASPTTATQT